MNKPESYISVSDDGQLEILTDTNDFSGLMDLIQKLCCGDLTEEIFGHLMDNYPEQQEEIMDRMSELLLLKEILVDALKSMDNEPVICPTEVFRREDKNTL